MNNRNQTLDIAKGMLIILVVLGHSIQYGYGYTYCTTGQFFDNLIFRCIYTFHMPLFMAISGFLFHYTNKRTYKEILTTRFSSIGLPFISYCTLLYIIWYNLNNIPHFYFSNYFLKLRGEMWFLSSLLLNCIIVSSITHLFQKNIKIGYVILWCLFPLTFIISDNYIPALHKYMYFYFLLGFVIKECSAKIPLFFLGGGSKWVFILLTCLTIICCFNYEKTIFIYNAGFCIYENGTIDYNKLYVNILRYIIGVSTSCWFMRIVFFIKSHTKTLIPFLTHIGQETLGIYGFQSIIFMTLSTIATIKDININMGIAPLPLCVITLLACEIAIRVCKLNRYTKKLLLGK